MKAAFKDWLDGAAKAADVSVDPQWGSWDSDNGAVIAPGAATSTTTSTSVDPNASTTTSLSPEELQQLLVHGRSRRASTDSGSSTSSSRPERAVAARIVVVGLGPAGPDLVTAGALARHRRAAERAAHRPATRPAAVVPDAASFDHVYETEAATLDAVYPRIVAELLALAREQGTGEIAYAVPGSPVVAERTVELLLGRGRGRRRRPRRSRCCRRCRSSTWPGPGSGSTRSPARSGWSTANGSTSTRRGSEARCSSPSAIRRPSCPT